MCDDVVGALPCLKAGQRLERAMPVRPRMTKESHDADMIGEEPKLKTVSNRGRDAKEKT